MIASQLPMTAAAAPLLLVACLARTATASGPVGHGAHLAAMDRIQRLEETVQLLLLAQRSAVTAAPYDANATTRSPDEPTEWAERRLQNTPPPAPSPTDPTAKEPMSGMDMGGMDMTT